MRVSIPTKIRVLQPDDSVREIDLEDYTRGVTSAALPADTPLEAFKAQAVAARTFGVVTQRHAEKQADVCTTRHCQIWLDSAISQVARAVDETRAIVLTFGKFSSLTDPGLSWRLPWPIQSHELVNMSQVRTLEVGYRNIVKTRVLKESQFTVRVFNGYWLQRMLST